MPSFSVFRKETDNFLKSHNKANRKKEKKNTYMLRDRYVEFILSWPSIAGHEPHSWLQCVFPVRLHWRRLLSFVGDWHLETASELRMRACACFPFPVLGPIWLVLGPSLCVCVLPPSLWEDAHCSRCPASALALMLFLHPLPHNSLDSDGEGFDEDIPLRTKCSKASHSQLSEPLSCCGSLYYLVPT